MHYITTLLKQYLISYQTIKDRCKIDGHSIYAAYGNDDTLEHFRTLART